jgi:hypothetical protein
MIKTAKSTPVPIKTLCFLQTVAAKWNAHRSTPVLYSRARADEPTTGFLHAERNNKNADAERESGYSFTLLETQQPKIIEPCLENALRRFCFKDCFLSHCNKSGEI